MHQEMLKAAERGEIFYVDDTYSRGGLTKAHDHTAKRSRLRGSSRKDGSTDYRQGQLEIGYRYYEGAARGTVMIGEAPDCDAYRKLYGWPEAVIQIQPDGSDTISVLYELNANLERAAISRRNIKEALLRHDWNHKWNGMFRIVDLGPSPGKLGVNND